MRAEYLLVRDGKLYNSVRSGWNLLDLPLAIPCIWKKLFLRIFMFRKIFILSVLVSVVACLAQTKDPIKPEVVAGLKIDTTTRSEVVGIYGDPQKQTVSGDLQGVCYVHYGWGKVQLLFLQFDQQNILRGKHLDDPRSRAECGSLDHTTQRGGQSGFSGGNSCTMDVQCGVGSRCVSGVCTGGIGPNLGGKCVSGDFGKKVCTNNGESCFHDADCL